MDNLFSLKGKTAWITGGKRMGQRVAEVLAEYGANVVISYNKSRREADDTIKKIKKHKIKYLILQCDVSSRKNVINAAYKIKKHFKKIDILVLMASLFDKVKMMSINEDDFVKNFNVHVQGTFWPIRECIGMMPKGSHVITISDRTSIGNIYPDYIPYVAAKAGVAFITKALAPELGKKAIFINSIAPGPIMKPDGLNKKYWRAIRNKSIVKYNINDAGAVDEFAKMVLYLSSSRSTGNIYSLELGHI